MLLVDVNVLVAAQRRDHVHHSGAAAWLAEVVNGDQPFGAPQVALSACMRIVTNVKAFPVPSPLDEAIGFVRAVRGSGAFVEVLPDTRHFERFLDLCERFELRGNDVSDAYLAASAIETRSDRVSFDRGFDRFGLRRMEP